MMLSPGHYTVMGQMALWRETAPGTDVRTLQRDRAACAAFVPRRDGPWDLTTPAREQGLLKEPL